MTKKEKELIEDASQLQSELEYLNGRITNLVAETIELERMIRHHEKRRDSIVRQLLELSQ